MFLPTGGNLGHRVVGGSSGSAGSTIGFVPGKAGWMGDSSAG